MSFDGSLGTLNFLLLFLKIFDCTECTNVQCKVQKIIFKIVNGQAGKR